MRAFRNIGDFFCWWRKRYSTTDPVQSLPHHSQVANITILYFRLTPSNDSTDNCQKEAEEVQVKKRDKSAKGNHNAEMSNPVLECFSVSEETGIAIQSDPVMT